ncbi:uncharacterized protein LOC134233380 [Saccostrea cucullata]|uniref:uncharacterized protein LOC134233380 n=1 Tax=Saccostrea cuccullata TaxID=36930 RepID=UPI002ED0B571
MGCSNSRLQDEEVPTVVSKRATKHSPKSKSAKHARTSNDTSYECCPEQSGSGNSEIQESLYENKPISLRQVWIFIKSRLKRIHIQKGNLSGDLPINPALDPVKFVDNSGINEQAKPYINIVPDAPPPPVLQA